MREEKNGLEGCVARLENGWAFGWAWNSESPNDPIEVDICVDGERIITTLANLYRREIERKY